VYKYCRFFFVHNGVYLTSIKFMYTTAGLGLGLGLVLVYEFGLEVHEYDHLTCMLM